MCFRTTFLLIILDLLLQARKEGNKEVVEKLESVLRVAMTEKKKTLRPEIQLLNTLLEADTTKARQEVRPSFQVVHTVTHWQVVVETALQLSSDIVAKCRR